MLKLTNVKKAYNGQTVLDGVNLEVKKGDVIAILGPSGSGKTTLLRIANFLEQADVGQMDFDEKHLDLARVSKRDITEIRKRTGFVFQSYNLFANYTALNNVTLGLMHAHGMKRDKAEAIAKEALTKVGLADRFGHYPSQLSGGQQQRVGIARAIAPNPEILYLDEPTSALDPELIAGVLGVIRELAEEGRTMVNVTHEMNFARKVANHVIFMEHGRIVEEGDPEELFTNPKEARTRQFLSGLGDAPSIFNAY